ncbi:hypothetical protein ACMA1D_02190 [Streptomyces sp. 796.1]|uniref:hypothetical protein n=1 Tax=Streptomyces sp. 796.1 TaxID=3163029 RepID=UPI0039C923D7
MPTTTEVETPAALMRRDGYMKPEEAAEDLGCGVRWLLDGLNRHGFPHTRMGKAKWLSEQDRIAIRELCHVPAQPGKISQLRRRSTSTKRLKSTA